MIYNIYTIYIVGGEKMATQMIVRIDPEIKNRLNKLARVEGKSTSKMVRELIENYINERDISAYIDDLWKRIGMKLKSKGVKQSDVGRAIKETRKR